MTIKPILYRLLAITMLSAPAALADQSVKQDFLPPLIKWHGQSEQLIVSDKNPWQTPAEKMNLTNTPDYQQTFAYLDKLVASDQRLNKISIGKSPQGRDIWMVIANQQGLKEADKLITQGKPTLLVQAGIHSGEIDGKDAGLMLLRDIIKGGKDSLLDQVNLLFVPILSVDGHERRSPYNRVNQRGPVQMGWRTNSENLNLNRDYAKLDTVELQHLVKVINQWQPDLYFDVHVTDGEDYQYDITFGFNGEHGDSPNISRWLSQILTPSVNQALANNGHLGGPLVFGVDRFDFSKGISGWTASPRYSNGYGDVRHLATVLIENHSLKPYRQRVLGTYIMLEESLKVLADKGRQLRKATSIDKKHRKNNQILTWQVDHEHPELIEFAGIEYVKNQDPVLGIDYIHWTGVAKTYHQLPVFWSRIAKTTVKRPRYYWIPPQYNTLIQRLDNHGIQSEKINHPVQLELTQLVANEAEFSKQPFEGHQIPTTSFTEEKYQTTLPAGFVRVSTNQDLGKLSVALLDPRAPDSFFKWGFFNQMFQRTEYIESYALIPLANAMIEKNPKLLTQFNQEKAKNKTFANDQRAQLKWFYQRSEYYDKDYLKYPILMEF